MEIIFTEKQNARQKSFWGAFFQKGTKGAKHRNNKSKFDEALVREETMT